MALTLLEREKSVVGLNAYQVTEAYQCPNSEIDTHLAALEGASASGFTGIETPVCTRARATKRFYDAATARIEAVYTTPDWQQWMMSNPNKAKVFTSPVERNYPRTRDLDGRLLGGSDMYNNYTVAIGQDLATNVAEGGKHPGQFYLWWKIHKGEVLTPSPVKQLTLRAVVDSTDNGAAKLMTPWSGKNKTVNGASATAIDADGGAGKLLFMGLESTPILANSALWLCSWTFLHHPDGWNNQCILRRHSSEIRMAPMARLINGDLYPAGLGFKAVWYEIQQPNHDCPARLFAEETTAFTNLNAAVV